MASLEFNPRFAPPPVPLSVSRCSLGACETDFTSTQEASHAGRLVGEAAARATIIGRLRGQPDLLVGERLRPSDLPPICPSAWTLSGESRVPTHPQAGSCDLWVRASEVSEYCNHGPPGDMNHWRLRGSSRRTVVVHGLAPLSDSMYAVETRHTRREGRFRERSELGDRPEHRRARR